MRIALVVALILTALAAAPAPAQARAPWAPDDAYLEGAYCPTPPRTSNLGFAALTLGLVGAGLYRRSRPGS